MKVVKKILKIFGWFLLGIVGLVLLVLVGIQTAPVKRQIVRIAENQVNKILDAQLSVGELTGNFFTNLALNDVLLVSTLNDTIAFIPQLRLNYRLMPLLSSEIAVDEVVIENPYIFLEQLSDSTWNLQHIVKTDPDKEDDTTSTGFNMLVNLNRLLLNNGNIRVETTDTIIPKWIGSLFIDVSGYYSSDSQRADLSDFRFITYNPDLEIRALNVNADADNQTINLKNLLLETRENRITAIGQYNFDRNIKSNIQLQTDPVILNEFKIFLPENFELNARPEILVNAELENEKLFLDLKVADNSQGVDLQLNSYHLIEYLSDTNSIPVSYDLALGINEVDVRYWLNDETLKYIIDGNLTAQGQGIDPATMNSLIKGNFDNILVYDYPVSKLNLVVDYNKGDVKGEIDGNGAFGYLYVKPDVRQILSDNPLYNLNLITRRFNLAAILADRKFKSDVNLNASVRGSGFNPDRISARSSIEMYPSTAMGFTIDTLNGKIDYINQNIIINSFYIETLSAQVQAEGNYNLRGDSDVTLEVDIENADEITALAGIDSLQTSARLWANLTGQPDSLHADMVLGLGRTQFKELVYVDSLHMTGSGSLVGNDIYVDADVETDKLTVSGMEFDVVKIQAQTDTKEINVGLDVNSVDIQTQLNAMVELGDIIKVALSDMWLGYKGYDWELSQDTAYINIATNEYEVINFNLESPVKDTLQSISANGRISLVGEQDFKVEIQDLNINQLIQVFQVDQNIRGLLNMKLDLQGTAQAPELSGDLNLDGSTFQNYRFDTLKGSLSYLDKEASIDLNIIPQDSGRFLVNGRMPIDIRLDSMELMTPQSTDPIFARLLIEEFPLSIVNIVYPLDDVRGFIESDISVDGTLGQPDINGGLNIVDGLVRLDQYGVNYSNIQADINVEREAVRIDTFLIQSNDGNMQIKGEANFASELYRGELNDSDVRISFNRFNPFDHRQFNMELSGGIDLSATQDSVVFDGDLTIPEVQIYLPAVMSLIGRSMPDEMPKPLLLVELERENIHPDSVIYTVQIDTSATEATSNLEFLNNLQGKLRVRIPRNMWIRNDDFRIELSGDVEVMKHQNFFELFGTIDVVRGQYNLLGKVFVIQTGIITFQGGEQINPLLNVEATYTFRDSDRNSRELLLTVSGEATAPEIAFTLEGQPISEGDALSYIIFGTSMDALASGQQDGLNSGMDAAGLAETVAASLISSQLTKFLGNTFNVDYIEFRGSSSFDNASFVVGKYITNKLFVSYEQTIGNIQDEDIARYEMKMEYEIFRFLFLQLTSSPITSGFDVIFKINSKQK